MTFLEEKTQRVELSNDEFGSLGNGELTFGGGSLISVQLSIFKQLPNADAGYPIKVMRAKAEEGQYFTLIECVAYGHTIYADYLVLGDVFESEFRKISILYSDVSEWFLQWRRIEGRVGEGLTWSGLPDHISTNFESEGRRFHLKTEYSGDVRRHGNSHILKERVEFLLQPEAGLLSLIDAREKAMELACLISILMTQPVSILELAVETSTGRCFNLYFPTFRPINRDRSDVLRGCFFQKNWLDEKWEEIFRNFFASPHRKTRWTRLAGMQRYEGFWEYNTLGYVTLLDSYVSHNPPPKLIRPPHSERMRQLRVALGKLRPRLGQQVLEKIIDAVHVTFSSNQEASFSEKYSAAAALVDPDILKIINLSDEDFRLIKKVRDKIAHGQSMEFKDSEFQKIHVVVSRIELLLTYWACLDFGLSVDDFLKGLGRPLSRLRRLARVNEKHLARVINSAEFFVLDVDSFAKLSSRNVPQSLACFKIGSDGKVDFSEEFFKIHRDWSLARHEGAYSADRIFGVPPDAVRYVGHMYVECGDESLEFYSAYLFDDSKLTDF